MGLIFAILTAKIKRPSDLLPIDVVLFQDFVESLFVALLFHFAIDFANHLFGIRPVRRLLRYIQAVSNTSLVETFLPFAKVEGINASESVVDFRIVLVQLGKFLISLDCFVVFFLSLINERDVLPRQETFWIQVQRLAIRGQRIFILTRAPVSNAE